MSIDAGDVPRGNCWNRQGLTTGRMRLAAAVLLALLAGPATAQEQTAPRTEEPHVAIFKRLSAAVVGIGCAGTTSSGASGTFYGTGVVVSPDGLVLTDLTVVPKDGRDVKVYFTDGRVKTADLKRIDEPSEGVLVKVDGQGLTHMKLADSSKARMGDPCYSWGNPFFTIQRDGMVSLSVGAVSGLYPVSSVDNQSRYLGPAIETDAAVNPGSDGGPLTDADGNLLGIMSLAFSRSRWLGLAIPVERLRAGLPELKALPAAPRPKAIESESGPWRSQMRLVRAADRIAKATIAVRAVGANEPDPPEKRSEETLAPLPPYPEGPVRVQREAQRPPGACASGVVVEADGTAITAAANVAGAARIFVYLADGRRVAAKLLGKDDALDLAVLKLEGPGKYDFAAPGGANLLKTGQSLAILGRSEAPGALTFNAGIVSALGRHVNTCAQVSALINYGNLGGPALNADGVLVGLAVHLTEKSAWRQNGGIGFILSAERIAQALPDLKAGKTLPRPKRPTLGIQVDLTAVSVKGVRIGGVEAGSGAAEAGIQAGDVLVELAGKPVVGMAELREGMRPFKAGDKVKVKLKRAGKDVELLVRIGETG